MRDALEGLLEPTRREKVLGRAEVRQMFTVPGRASSPAASSPTARSQRGSQARLVRDNVVVHDGRIGSLRRFKDDVREVASGYECGIGLENFQDVKVGDVIEAYEIEEVARRLAPAAGGRGRPQAGRAPGLSGRRGRRAWWSASCASSCSCRRTTR